MTEIQDISSGVTNSDNTANDKFRDTFDAIGRPGDAAATSTSVPNSAVSLFKGMLDELDLAAGTDPGPDVGMSGDNPNLLDDGLAAMGAQSDGPATDTSSAWSAVSLAKGILTTAGFV